MRGELTIKQIAVLAAVSRSTVSRVLNNHPYVRPEVRAHVLRIVREHNYVPHAAAQSLARKSSRTIGLLIPPDAALLVSDLFFSQATQSIAAACADRRYQLSLVIAGSDGDSRGHWDILRSKQLDGIIVLSSDIDDPALPELVCSRTPLVLIGRHPYAQRLSWVDADNREGARKATAHLVSLGHRRIATITGSQQMVVSVDRRDGYKQALLEAGLPSAPELIVAGDFTAVSGFQAMARLLRLADRPTAVFVASDTMALGAMRAAREHGLAVPDDIALVGFDDLPIASYADPPLTTIRQPIAKMGSEAVRVLVEQITDQSKSGAQMCLPTELIIRGSCGASTVVARRR